MAKKSFIPKGSVKKTEVVLRGGPFHGHKFLITPGITSTLKFSVHGQKGVYSCRGSDAVWEEK